MTNPKINIESLNRAHWSAEDKKNVQSVLEFVQLIMNDHDFEEISLRYAGGAYKQHNRNIADGIEGVIKAVGDLVKNAPEFS